jgi:hypothetical protein
MARDGRHHPRCSFCGKSKDQVTTLVAGPGVYICDRCVALCNQVIAEGPPPPPERAGSLPGAWVRSSVRRVLGQWFRRFRTMTAPAS